MWSEFCNLQDAQEATQTKIQGIELELTESTARFRIGRHIWDEGKNIGELVEYLQTG